MGNVVLETHLVVHELQREGRLPHATAAHHDHLMESQRGLALVLAGGHDSGLWKPAGTGRDQQDQAETSRDQCIFSYEI